MPAPLVAPTGAGSLARARVARVASRAATRASSAWSRGGVRALAARRDRGDRDDDAVLDARSSSASLAASLAVSAALVLASPSSALAAVPPPAYSGVDPDSSELVQRLLARSKENKAAYDEQRLDNFYRRDYRINGILGKELLPEPCDPRDPEFGYKCGSPLPRLPQARTDPFDPRSDKYAPRRGAVFGLNDLDIEEEDDFPGTSSRIVAGAEAAPGESESSDEGFDGGEEDAARETGTTETEESDGPETPVPPDVPGSEGILFE